MISSVNISLDGKHGGWGCTRPIARLEGHLGPRGVAQFGGVLCVTLAVDQHQRIPHVVLDDVRDAAEILKNKTKQG